MKTTLLILFVLLLSTFAQAATFTVTNLNDSGTGSLRQAIIDAGNNAGDDAIIFQTGLNGTISLTSGELLVSNNVTINGLGANVIAVSGGGQSRVFNIAPNAVVNLNNLTVTGGFVPQSMSGGICGFGILNDGNLTASYLKITNNSTTSNTGCGLGVSNNGTMTLDKSSISGNTSNPTLGPSIQGGGIRNAGNLTITDSTISSNVGREGGGIANLGNLTINNSTVYGNMTRGGGNGSGGISQQNGSLDVKNSTIANNKSGFMGGINIYGGVVTLYNSIIANNTDSAPNPNNPTDVRGTVISLGNNLIGSTNGNSGWISSDLLNVDPILRPLADNGGPTQTAALSQSSIAVNAGNNQNAPTTDQRGFNRIVGGIIDIGSFELQTVCTYVVSPTEINVSAAGETIPVNIATSSDCVWDNSNNGTIATISPLTGLGNATVEVTVPRNFGAARTLTVIIAGKIVNLNQASGCSYSVSSGTVDFGMNGGTSSFSVSTGQGCPWSASTNVPWITISTPTGTGSGGSSFTVAANSGIPRTGTITVAGNTITITQAGICSYSVSPTTVNISGAGGSATVNVTAPAGCNWGTINNSGIATLTPTSGVGNGTVTVSVPQNSGPARSATVTVAGQVITINQSSGCTYSVSPTSVVIAASGGTAMVNVTAPAGCAWTASSGSTNATVSPSSGTGNGVVTITAPQNLGGARATAITVAGEVVIVNQASGCAYGLEPTSFNFGAGGGNSNFRIITGRDCSWTAVSNAPWITISNPSGVGTAFIQYSVAANPTGPSRTGTITIADQTFTVTQSGTCSFAFNPDSFYFSAAGGSDQIIISAAAGCQWTATSSVFWIQITSNNSGTGNGALTFTVAANTTNGLRTGSINIGDQVIFIRQGSNTANKPAFDFDGDQKADLAVFRPSNGVWYLMNSSTGNGGLQFGSSTDKLVPADYDNDGKTDLAVFRNGSWYIQRSALGFTNLQFGEATDIPVPADFDADGKTDLAVYRPSTGIWYVQRSTQGFTAFQFGSSGDKPVAADFDGDGRADFAVFRPSSGIWYVQQSSAGFGGLQFGSAEDKLVVADYDGDGRADFAVFRPSNGFWYLQRSTAGFTGIQFGQAGDIPVAADYDGDGKADIAVYRNDTWFIQRSTQGFTGVQFGQSGDVPVENAFVR